MKKFWFGLIGVMLCICSSCTQQEQGKTMEMDVHTQANDRPFVDDIERTQVPFVKTLKDFSYDVSWNFVEKIAGTQNIYEYTYQNDLSEYPDCEATLHSGNIMIETDGQDAKQPLILSDAEEEEISTTHSTEAMDQADIFVEPEQKLVYHTMTYIGNQNSKVFHVPSCTSVKRMKESNQVILENKEDALAQGYRPCKICQP